MAIISRKKTATETAAAARKKPVGAVRKTVAPAKPKAQVAAKKMTAPAAKAAGAEPKEKVRKPKLVRDSFTMPEAEYAVLGKVKKACLAAGVEVKKSQLLRLGLALLNKTEMPALKKMIAELTPLKAGRPKKEK